MTHLWKVSGQRVVFAVLDLPDPSPSTAPWPACRSSRRWAAAPRPRRYPIYDYRTFAADMKEQLKG